MTRHIARSGALPGGTVFASHPAGRTIALLLLMATCAFGADAPSARRQVLPNPGFESGTSGWEIGKIAEGNQIAADDQARSGSRSLKLIAAKPDENMVVTSDWFAVAPDAELDGDVWIRTDSMQGGEAAQGRGRQRGGLSVSLEVFGPDKTTQKMTLRIGGAGGPAGQWVRHQAQTLLSQDCAWARYRISFTNSTGTVWIDDAAANYMPVPAPDTTGVEMPPLVPQPWLVKRGGESIALGKTAVIVPNGEDRLRAAAAAYLASLGVEHAFTDGAANGSKVLLRFADASDRDVFAQLQSRFPGHDLKELGDEGYLLSVQKADGDRAVIFAAANTERGRFYALQTLRQVAADGKLHAIDVLDRPTMLRRGIVMSNGRFRQPDTLDRMAASKMNTSWGQGGFVNGKFKQKWREPFNAEELATLKAFIDKADANFITPWMALGPRGDYDHRAQTDLPRPHPGEVQYSSDKDIDVVVDKMDQLYGIGLRRFGINFDDLQNYREQTLIGGDRQRWGDDNAAFAKAHAHFFSQIISRLRARHPGEDLKFMTVPYSYWYPSRGRGGSYLRTLAEGLPTEVEMITCSYTDADILAMTELTGRPTMVWHNYFVEDAKTASHRLTNTEYGTPFWGLYTWTDPQIRAGMSGLINLMSQPGETPEDTFRTSYGTAADWQWAPDRYDPYRAFQAAAAQHRLSQRGVEAATKADLR